MKIKNLIKIISNLKTKTITMYNSKEEALKALTDLENKQKESAEQSAKLRKIIEDFDKPKNIMEQVKDFSDILRIAKEKGYITEWFEKQCFEDRCDYAHRKLKLIAQVLNEGHIFKRGENRWYPYFSLSSGFDFFGSYCAYDGVYTSGGFRLCFKSEKLSDFVGKTFTQEFRDFLMND